MNWEFLLPYFNEKEEIKKDAALLFIFSTVIFLLLILLRQRFLVFPDSLNYATVAREVSRGNGFTTKQIRPLSLFFDNNYQNHPTLVRPPLYPLLVAISQKIFGYVGFASIFVNLLAFSAIPPSIY